MKYLKNRVDVIFLVMLSFVLILIPLSDILIKSIVVENFDDNTIISTAIPFLKIMKVKNFGVAFGFFRNNNLFIFSSVIIILAVMIMLIVFGKIQDRITILGICFAIGGGIGNLIDRIFFGYVIDYFKVDFFSPVFNLSDCFICLGITFIIIENLKVQN